MAKRKVREKRRVANQIRKAVAEVRLKKRKKSRLSISTLKKFKNNLLEYKERITGDYNNLRNSHLHSSQRDSAGDLSGYGLHMADIGTDTYDRDLGLSVAASEQDILYRIDQALKRIEEKSYGLCELCDGTIRLVRLKAVPWARLCIRCKESEEKKGETA